MTGALQPVRFELEVPEPWLLPDGHGQHYRHYVSSIVAALARRRATASLQTIPYHCDFAPRRAPPHSILLSYHSVGDAPNVWRIKESPIVSYFSFDRLGYSGWSEFARSQDIRSRIAAFDLVRAEAIRASESRRQTDNNLSKYPQPVRKAGALQSGYVLFALQIAEDTVQKLQSLDQLDVLFQLAQTTKSRSETLVVKRHPLCRDSRVSHALREVGFRFSNVQISTDSIVDLVEGASRVVVGNSGVGFEALMHRKRVFCFGRSDYEAAVERFDSLADVADMFDRPPTVSAEDATRFIGLYLTEFCFDVRDIGSVAAKLDMAVSRYQTDERPRTGEVADLLAAHAGAETARRALVHARSLAETSVRYGSRSVDPSQMRDWPSDHHFPLPDFVPPTQRELEIEEVAGGVTSLEEFD